MSYGDAEEPPFPEEGLQTFLDAASIPGLPRTSFVLLEGRLHLEVYCSKTRALADKGHRVLYILEALLTDLELIDRVKHRRPCFEIEDDAGEVIKAGEVIVAGEDNEKDAIVANAIVQYLCEVAMSAARDGGCTEVVTYFDVMAGFGLARADMWETGTAVGEHVTCPCGPEEPVFMFLVR